MEEKNRVNIELNTQLDLISKKSASSEKVNKLKSELKVENQIENIDVQINEYENQSSELNNELRLLHQKYQR